MIWFLYVIAEILFTLICYITNPIVVLFADEYGNLPYKLRYWQTWDNCLDIDWMIYEDHIPKIFHYDFNKHYKYISEDHERNILGHVLIIDPNFTFTERIKRYFCRVAWLYRNTGYGFSYEVLGADIDGSNIIKTEDIKSSGYLYQVYYTNGIKYWMIRYNHRWSKRFSWKIFLGWKMQSVKPNEIQKCMLAFCINPFK